MMDTKKRLYTESLVAIVASIFFWIWALIITIQDGLDTGLICFIPTFASGVGGLLLAKDIKLPRPLLLIETAIAFSFTAVAFILAATHNEEDGESQMHLAYLIISAFIWGGFGVIYIFEINKVYRLEDLQRESNALLL
jgi:F0F1-type ATP synthase assembly protein I